MENQKPIDQTVLEEYKLCRATTEGLDRNIWQTASIFTVGSAAGLVTFLLKVDTSNVLTNFRSCILGLLAIGILCTWYRLARRWDSVKHAMIIRMEDIERDFNLRANLYVRFLDEHKQRVPDSDVKPLISENSFKRLERHSKNHEYRGIQPMLKYVVAISVLSWLALVVIPSFASILGLQLPQTVIIPQIVALLCVLFFLVFGIFQWTRP